MTMPPEIHLTIGQPSGLPDELLIAGIGLGASILGAVVGAWMTGLVTRRLADEQHQRAELAQDDAVSFALLHKLNRIYSAQVGIVAHIAEGRNNQKNCHPPRLSLAVMPFANGPSRVSFSPEEMFRLTRVGGIDLMNSTSSLDECHNAAAEAMETYRDQRLAMVESWTGETKGAMLSTGLTDEMMAQATPRLAMLDGLLEQVDVMARRNTQETFAALRDLTLARGRYFKKKVGIDLPDPDGKPVEIRYDPTDEAT
jgi:hypothetical protein